MSLQQARKHPEHTGNPQLGQFCQDPVRITFTEEARSKGAFPERENGGKAPQHDLLGKGGRPCGTAAQTPWSVSSLCLLLLTGSSGRQP